MGLRIFGESLEELFENAACGFFWLITGLENVEEKVRVEISVEAQDKEELLVRWLSELLFRFEVDGLLFRKFKVLEISPKILNATALGERFNPDRHELKTEIKGVTYHQLKVEHVHDGWITEVIFDV